MYVTLSGWLWTSPAYAILMLIEIFWEAIGCQSVLPRLFDPPGGYGREQPLLRCTLPSLSLDTLTPLLVLIPPALVSSPCLAPARVVKVYKIQDIDDTQTWNAQKVYKPKDAPYGDAAYLTSLVKPYDCWPRSGDACHMLPRRSDCACLEDGVPKARSRADQPLTMRKAADLTEAGTNRRSGRELPPPPHRLIDAARPGSRRMSWDDQTVSTPTRHRIGVLFAGSRAARPDCMWEGAAARRPPVFSGLPRAGEFVFLCP